MDVLEKTKISRSYRNLNPEPSNPWPSCRTNNATPIVQVVAECRELYSSEQRGTAMA